MQAAAELQVPLDSSAWHDEQRCNCHKCLSSRGCLCESHLKLSAYGQTLANGDLSSVNGFRCTSMVGWTRELMR